MKLSTKSASLSALLFPGSGHIFLKCYLRGFILIIVAGIGLIMMMGAAFDIALSMADQIEQGTISLSPETLTTLIKESLAIYQSPSLHNAKLAIIISWIVGTADAYRIGRKREQVT